jgi:hypothetical protein
MKQILLLSFLAISIMFSVTAVLVTKYIFASVNKKNPRWRSLLFTEVVRLGDSQKVLPIILTLTFAYVAMVAFNFVILFLYPIIFTPFLKIGAIFLIISATLTYVFCIVSMFHFKVHLISFIGAGLTNIGSLVFLIYYLISPPLFQNSSIVFIILATFLILYNLAILLNPRLKSWGVNDNANDSKDGIIENQKAKVLPVSEHLITLNVFLTAALYLIYVLTLM